MARGEWGNQQGRGGGAGKCLYKRTTAIIICSINLVAVLYVLHSLLTSLYIFSNDNATPSSFTAAKYTVDQIKIMQESIRVRIASEPVQLVSLVEKIKNESSREQVLDLPQLVKQKIADELLQRLKELKGDLNVSQQQAALEIWRKEKLEEISNGTVGNGRPNSSSLAEESKMLARALESGWNILLEDIGLWIPDEIINKEEENGKFESEEELDQIIPGRPIPPECHAELHTDYDGAAVRWGLTHHKESAADCCQACLDQAKNAKPGQLKCNIWVYCPSEAGCFSPDIYEHKHQECWLKQADKPKLNFKDKYAEWYRNAHPTAPVVVPWISGVAA